MKVKWLSLVIAGLILLLVTVASCATPVPQPFPPPEGYPSWDAYEEATRQSPPPTPTPTPTPTPIPTPTTPSAPQYNWEITNLRYKITEKGENYWYFSWQATVKNNISSSIDFFVQVNFVDKDGFIIDWDIESLVLNPKEQRSIKGTQMIEAELASGIKRIELGDVSAFTRD